MSTAANDFKTVVKNAAQAAKRKAFRKGFPYATLVNGQVVLVYPDQHTEPATPETLAALTR